MATAVQGQKPERPRVVLVSGAFRVYLGPHLLAVYRDRDDAAHLATWGWAKRRTCSRGAGASSSR